MTAHRFPVRAALAALLPTLLLAGCAREQPVEERARERWELLIAGKPGQAWEYLTPGTRQVKDRESYAREKAAGRVQWSGVEVLGKTCPEEDRCTVHVKVDYSLHAAVRGVGTLASKQLLDEVWIRSDGRWFHLPDAPVEPVPESGLQ